MNSRLDYEYCHAAPVLEWMSRKWALVILMRMEEANRLHSHESGIRFGDLFRTIPHISEKVLASTLNYLENEGFTVRTFHEGATQHVEYSLTPIAKSFLREISYVVEWGQLHFEEIQKNRR